MVIKGSKVELRGAKVYCNKCNHRIYSDDNYYRIQYVTERRWKIRVERNVCQNCFDKLIKLLKKKEKK